MSDENDPRTSPFSKRFEVINITNLRCSECASPAEYLVRFRDHPGRYACEDHVGTAINAMKDFN